MLTFVGNLTIAVLVAPTFAAYAGISLELALQLSAFIAISLSVGISIPDLALNLALCVQLAIGINLAISIGLPSVAVSLGLALSARLSIVLGLVASIEAIIALSIGAGANLEAFSYVGAGAGTMGAAVTAALAGGWPDGTPPTTNIAALLLVATSHGTVGGDAVASATLLGGGANYETGLCSVQFSAPPIGGTTATGTPVLSSGAITGITITSNGSGYVTPPSVTISDSTPVLGATNATPIVVTVADTTDIAGITITEVQGNTAANGMWCAKILSSTTMALYADSAFTVPSVGNGTWASSTGIVTGNGTNAAAIPIMGGGSIRQLTGFFDGLTFPASGLSAGITIGLSVLCGGTFGLLADLLGNLQLQAKILAGVTASFSVVPPTIAGNLSVVAGMNANLTAALRFIPPLPSIQASLSAALSAQIALIGAIVAKIGIQLGFATETIGVYTYSGPGNGLGAAITAGLPATAGSMVLLGATTPAAQATLAAFFAGA